MKLQSVFIYYGIFNQMYNRCKSTSGHINCFSFIFIISFGFDSDFFIARRIIFHVRASLGGRRTIIIMILIFVFIIWMIYPLVVSRTCGMLGVIYFTSFFNLFGDIFFLHDFVTSCCMPRFTFSTTIVISVLPFSEMIHGIIRIIAIRIVIDKCKLS